MIFDVVQPNATSGVWEKIEKRHGWVSQGRGRGGVNHPQELREWDLETDAAKPPDAQRAGWI